MYILGASIDAIKSKKSKGSVRRTNKEVLERHRISNHP